MRPRSYVGITGYETAAQVAAVRNSVPADRLMMVGCGMRGHPTRWNPDKWPNRCPYPSKLPSIFGSHPNVLNVLHFTPLEGCDLFEHMCMAHEVAGPNFHGIQLNMPWPDVDPLIRYKSRFQGAIITIPLQPDALDVFGQNPNPMAIARRLKDYDGIADYTLIDASAGYGQELDVDFTLRCYDAISTLMPDLGLVAAGGLRVDNAEAKLAPILERFEVGTDMEGRVRTPPPDDHLILAEAIRSMQTIDALLRKYEAQRKPQLVN